MSRLIVDAMNVIGSRPNGWWRDRAGANRRLVERLQRLAAVESDEVTAVLEVRPLPGLSDGVHGGVRVHYATRVGRDAGDDAIVDFVSADAAPGTLTVVTSDRGLAARVTALGAQVVGGSAFLRRLDRLD